MQETRRTNQGGSIATFVVIGIILVVALVGGVYFVNIRGQQAKNNQEIATSETKNTKPADNTQPQPDTSATDNKADVPTKAEAGAETSADVEPSDTNNDTDVSAGVVDTPPSPQDIPTTGADFSIGQLMGAGLLTAAAVSYVSSRRRRAFSL